jgi:hypothetical protein
MYATASVYVLNVRRQIRPGDDEARHKGGPLVSLADRTIYASAWAS